MGWLFKRGGLPAKVGDRIRGVVTHPGAAGSDEGSCFAVVFLRPWIDAQGVTRRSEVHVEIPAPSSLAGLEYALQWEGKAVALTVTHAWPARRNTLGGVRTLTLEPTTLGELANEEPDPVVVEDQILGEMRLEPALGALVGARRTGVLDYELMIDASADVRPAQARRLAHAARRQVAKIEGRLAVLRQACADELLGLHNERWIESGHLKTHAAFKRALTVHSIHSQRRCTTIYLGAGDLFGEHGVEIRLSPRGRVREILVS